MCKHQKDSLNLDVPCLPSYPYPRSFVVAVVVVVVVVAIVAAAV